MKLITRLLTSLFLILLTAILRRILGRTLTFHRNQYRPHTSEPKNSTKQESKIHNTKTNQDIEEAEWKRI